MVASAAGANAVGSFGVFHNELSANRRGAVSGPGGVTRGTAGGGGAVGAGTVVVTAGCVVPGAAVVVVGAIVVGVGAGGRAGAIVVVVGVVTAGGGVSASPGRTGTSSRHVDEEPFAGSSGRRPASRMSSRCSPLQRPLEPSPTGRRGCSATPPVERAPRRTPPRRSRGRRVACDACRAHVPAEYGRIARAATVAERSTRSVATFSCMVRTAGQPRSSGPYAFGSAGRDTVDGDEPPRSRVNAIAVPDEGGGITRRIAPSRPPGSCAQFVTRHANTSRSWSTVIVTGAFGLLVAHVTASNAKAK